MLPHFNNKGYLQVVFSLSNANVSVYRGELSTEKMRATNLCLLPNQTIKAWRKAEITTRMSCCGLLDGAKIEETSLFGLSVDIYGH